jgi:hypothetical protein
VAQARLIHHRDARGGSEVSQGSHCKLCDSIHEGHGPQDWAFRTVYERDIARAEAPSNDIDRVSGTSLVARLVILAVVLRYTFLDVCNHFIECVAPRSAFPAALLNAARDFATIDEADAPNLLARELRHGRPGRGQVPVVAGSSAREGSSNGSRRIISAKPIDEVIWSMPRSSLETYVQ